jgi:hypothetical protein
MNASRSMPRGVMLPAIVMAALSILANSAIAEKKKSFKQAVKAADAAFADYRSWKAVNPEPIAVQDRRWAACGPARRANDPQDANPHMGGFINVYVNAAGRDAYLSDKLPRFETGTVIVKEKMTTAKAKTEPHELGVMIKRAAGYAPEGGDWQYLFVNSVGTVREAQATVNCAGCHKSAAGRDYVFRRLPANEASANDED